MIYWSNYINHTADIQGKRKKFDNTIYSFDIETSSYYRLNGRIYPAIEYNNLSDKEKEDAEFFSNMYIWMFSINDKVYYGRTWEELIEFLYKLEKNVPERKVVFVHNLAFEFQYIKSIFRFESVMARKSRKVMKCLMSDYNIEFRCSYMMTNCSLAKLSDVFLLPIEKKVGDLDYDKIRNYKTVLSDEELGYCEYDCLVLYEYIKKELEQYDNVTKIPMTSTGKVRRELKELIEKDYGYKAKVKKSINVDPHIYNMLVDAFQGGFTHANYLYTDEIIENVDSWDFTSSYPFVLTTYKYPAYSFKKCYIQKREDMSEKLAYLIKVRFTNLKCKYWNNFISASKCKNIINAKYDNGRIIEADSLEITLTDIDFYFLLDTYECNYEILESYYSYYKYLPKQLIEFILEKYVNKTKYKNVFGKELEYNLEKAKFNSIYGMSVTNNIRDEVIFDIENDWQEIPLSNEEIQNKLLDEYKKGFMSFSWRSLGNCLCKK